MQTKSISTDVREVNLASTRLEPLSHKKGLNMSIDGRYDTPEAKNVSTKLKSLGNKIKITTIADTGSQDTRNMIKKQMDSLGQNTSFTNSFTGKSMRDDLYQSQIKDNETLNLADKLQKNKYTTSIEKDRLEKESKKLKTASHIYNSVYQAIKPSIE
mmetsp:Transcript_22900/g.20359  ORF Transcript_22900/g.20359 Transcript_22900/m.20359 type:complete len:157 (-) Transcript_22900:25-495(-)